MMGVPTLKDGLENADFQMLTLSDRTNLVHNDFSGFGQARRLEFPSNR
jgi:hypothetical protein